MAKKKKTKKVNHQFKSLDTFIKAKIPPKKTPLKKEEVMLKEKLKRLERENIELKLQLTTLKNKQGITEEEINIDDSPMGINRESLDNPYIKDIKGEDGFKDKDIYS